MKLLLICALLPMAMCLPSWLDEDKIKADIQFLAQKFASSDLTKKACETVCQQYMDEEKEANLAFGCPLACIGIQNALVKHLEPDHKRAVFGKINITSLFDLETLKQDLQLMVDMVGSDPVEQQCESSCHRVLQMGHVFNYGCPLVCHGFQTLVQHLHIHPHHTTPSTA